MTTVFAVSGLAPRQGASLADVANAERALGARFPEDYRHFLTQSDGLEGPIGRSGYLMLFSVRDLAEINEAADVAEFAPGFVIIGSDGGGTTYGFISGRTKQQYARVPDMDLSTEALEPLGGSLLEMVRRLTLE